MSPSKSPHPQIASVLAGQVRALDSLLADVERGINSQRQFDALEERAQGIAAGVRSAFRGMK